MTPDQKQVIAALKRRYRKASLAAGRDEETITLMLERIDALLRDEQQRTANLRWLDGLIAALEFIAARSKSSP